MSLPWFTMLDVAGALIGIASLIIIYFLKGLYK